MLSASFENEVGTAYNYDVEDKLKQDTLPPSAIQINELPKNGKIITTDNDGNLRELKVGDIVSTEEMKSFSYDQGNNMCSSGNKGKCKDSFQYTTMSSWVGTGAESESMINLTPVQIEDDLEMNEMNKAEDVDAGLPAFEMSPQLDQQESLMAQNTMSGALPIDGPTCVD